MPFTHPTIRMRQKVLPGFMANERPIRAKVGTGPLSTWAIRRHDFDHLMVGATVKIREPGKGTASFEVVVSHISTETSEPHYYLDHAKC